MNGLPAWLSSEPFQELFNKLVDRLDSAQARGSSKAQTVPLSKNLWPSFYIQQYESDREALWQQVLLCTKLGLIALTPERAANSPTGYDMSPRLEVKDPERVRALVGRPERVKSISELWREAVFTHLQGDDLAKKVVAGYCIELEGHSPAAIVQQINRLHSEVQNSGLLLREVSSRLFWGMSKVLDSREGLVAAVLGLDECPFPASPIQLHVMLPYGKPYGILFVENLTSFEKAVRSTSTKYRGMSLVFASGFKASAKRLRSMDGVSLFYSRRGSMKSTEVAYFEEWLFQGTQLPVYFWGDLDWAGMRILATLRESFGNVTAWQPGYESMREYLLNGRGHQPETADKNGQRPIAATGCSYADAQLLPLLDSLGFVDQELFSF